MPLAPRLRGLASPVDSSKDNSAAIAGIVYALMVLVVWGSFNPRSGLSYETGFPYNSETSSLLGGFLYTADSLRIHTNAFYHLSYVIGDLFGVGGSYVPFQIVYAVLWWARGFVVFTLCRKFLPEYDLVSYLAGALVLVHASDRALQWVGQMNQFGFIFWMLLGFYLFTLGLEATNKVKATVLTLAACFFEYMSLWSYESQLVLLLIFPLLLILHPRRRWRRLAVQSIAWYSVPAIYIRLAALKYSLSAGGSYQESVMRKGWTSKGVLLDWGFNIKASLAFWTWIGPVWKSSETSIMLLSMVSTALFLAGGGAIIRYSRKRSPSNRSVFAVRTAWIVVVVGVMFLVLSFPIYLLLDSARTLWRTQFLSGIGASLVFTGMIVLSSRVFKNRFARITVLLVLSSCVVYVGSLSAIQSSAFHRWVWERHRTAIVQILHCAPSVRAGTVVVVTNVPKDSDPFVDNQWFDLAIRLAYPGIPVAGVYFYTDGTPGPGVNLRGEDANWKWDQTGFPPMLHETPLANTIVVDFDAAGAGELGKTIPPFVCRSACALDVYDPLSRILGEMSPRAARRFRP
jgi:hypothetical protein